MCNIDPSNAATGRIGVCIQRRRLAHGGPGCKVLLLSSAVIDDVLTQIISYLVQDIPPLISLIPSTARTPNSANLSANYHVPGTEITLHITTFTHPMPAASLKRVILQGIARVEAHLDLYGDGWLSTEDEPYTISIPGCVFFAKSNSIPVHARQQHLTYGIVNSVLAGLWQWMIIGNRLDVVTFDIEDATWGVVGMGVVAPY